MNRLNLNFPFLYSTPIEGSAAWQRFVISSSECPTYYRSRIHSPRPGVNSNRSDTEGLPWKSNDGVTF